MKLKFNKQNNITKGFTLIELIVSIAIFAIMTSLLLSKYGNFNQGILLTNLAYDVALTIRNAQSYGLNVKSSDRASNLFDYPYGVHFDANNEVFTFFADVNSNGDYNNPGDTIVSDTRIKRGSQIGNLCLGTSVNCTPVSKLNIIFKRPDPNALFNAKTAANADVTGNYAEITLKANDGSIKVVVVRSTGQIAVNN